MIHNIFIWNTFAHALTPHMKYVITICQQMVGPRYCELCLNCPRASMCPNIVNYIMFVTSYSVTYCIYIPGKPGFCSHYCADYEECKYSDTFWLADRVRLFVHYTISLSSLCKLIWGHWTYEMPVRYILSCVSKIEHIFSVIHFTIYGAVCFQFTHSPCDDWENIHYVLLSSSNRKYELLSIV